MILPIVIYGDPVLRVDCPPVTDVTEETRTLAENMVETMYEADGVGLAAPQVGVALQLAVVDVSHAPELQSYFRVDGQEAVLKEWMPLVFINPDIEPGRARAESNEGCLSFPGLRYQIKRPAQITARLTLLDGRVITVETDGLLARALQHETDHLHGRLFIDRLSSVDKLTLKRRLREMYEDIEEEEREARLAARKARSTAPE
jgi:peptide deformylase